MCELESIMTDVNGLEYNPVGKRDIAETSCDDRRYFFLTRARCERLLYL